ncbi:MAG: hypothetical protein QOJ19_4409 [Acidimicrobiia bacterium]|nr:hypothetical protein [Acidimicrobiia bacterium]
MSIPTHVKRNRALDFHPLTSRRMGEGQAAGVEQRASGAMAAIQVVAHDRKPAFREVYPDLVCATGLRSGLDQPLISTDPLPRAELRDGQIPASSDGPIASGLARASHSAEMVADRPVPGRRTPTAMEDDPGAISERSTVTTAKYVFSMRRSAKSAPICAFTERSLVNSTTPEVSRSSR